MAGFLSLIFFFKASLLAHSLHCKSPASFLRATFSGNASPHKDCLSWVSCRCDKTPWQKQLRGDCLAHNSSYSQSLLESHNSRSGGELVTWHHSQEQGAMNTCTLPSARLALPLSIQSRVHPTKCYPPPLRVGFPTSINPINESFLGTGTSQSNVDNSSL